MCFLCLLVLLGSDGSPQPSAPSQKRQALSLVRILGVTTLAGKVEEGGFEARYHKGTYLLDSVSPCGSYIYKAVTQWAKKNNLRELKNNVAPDRTLIHLAVKEVTGFLELKYQLGSNQSEASVSLTFFDSAGGETHPELLPRFDALQIDLLVPRLKEAIACKP